MRPRASFPGKSPRLDRQHEDQHIVPKFNGRAIAKTGVRSPDKTGVRSTDKTPDKREREAMIAKDLVTDVFIVTHSMR